MNKKVLLFSCIMVVLIAVTGGCTTSRARDLQQPLPREQVICKQWLDQAESATPQK